MWEVLNPFVGWLGATPFSQWIGTSTTRIAWLFTFHLFGLVLLLGGTLALSLRLLGLALRQVPQPALARIVFPMSTTGLLVMVVSGFVIFAGGAESYYEGYWFRLKMVLLLIAAIFHFTAYRIVVGSDPSRFSPVLRGGIAVFAILVWFSVGWTGRAIAFF